MVRRRSGVRFPSPALLFGCSLPIHRLATCDKMARVGTTPPTAVPPRPDLPIASPKRRMLRRLTFVGAICGAAILAIVVLVLSQGSDPPVGGIAVAWVEGRTYEFEVVSWAEGETDTSSGVTRRADASEDVRFTIEKLDAHGSVVATMEVTDRYLEVDGEAGTLRDPFTVAVELSPEGFVSSRFGFGVPTGVSEGTGLLSPGQFMPVLRSRDVRPGDRWEDELRVDSPSGGDPAVWLLEGRFLGKDEVNGTSVIHIEATLTSPASTESLPEQGLEFTYSEIVIDQDIYLDAETHELVLYMSEQDGQVEVRSLDAGDVLVRFDGTLGLRVRSTS